MQTSGTLLGPEYGEIKDIPNPFSFQCEVRGGTLTATVIVSLNHPLNAIYRTEFNNRYISDFVGNDFGWTEVLEEGVRKKPSSYFFAIKQDLNPLLGFEIYSEYYCFRLPVKGISTNEFVTLNKEPGNFYSVKYNGDYQFLLTKTEKGWHAGTISKLDSKPVDNELARNISLLIESKN